MFYVARMQRSEIRGLTFFPDYGLVTFSGLALQGASGA
jgi:hypothetical protein